MTVLLIIVLASITGCIGWNAGRWVQHSKDTVVFYDVLSDLEGIMVDNIIKSLGPDNTDLMNRLDNEDLEEVFKRAIKGMVEDLDE